MRALPILVCALVLAGPAAAETVQELQAQLDAQVRINELLKQRIRTLEGEAQAVAVAAPPAIAAPAPARAADDPDEARALERALVREGIAVLPPGSYEIAPGIGWTHSASGSDTYSASLDGRMGLQGGWMIGAGIPFLKRDTSLGGNSGPGDVSVSVWKEIWAQDGTRPSLVANLRYRAPTGKDFTETDIPLGSGFHRLRGGLSMSKSIDPVAFYGGLSYTRTFARTVYGRTDLRYGDALGGNVGTSLAVTPEISLSTGVGVSFNQELEVDGVKVPGSDSTVASVNLGAGILLNKDLFLNISGVFGVTDESPDFGLGVSLPMRF
ncbi:transporter [Halomonas aquatica]|uniref:Transporter n=1 Tax=Halomonas aquatica TaxID=3151123 RepID=A0ABV1NJY1_9GAMM